MKAFTFPLEKVLAFRKTQWEAESALLETLLAQRQKLGAERWAAVEAIGTEAAALRGRTGISGGDLARYGLARTSCLHRIRRLDLSLVRVEKRVAEQQASCLRAKRDYELVLRLREKRLAEWQGELAREEEALSAEAYLAKFTKERQSQRRLAISSRSAFSPNSSPGVSPTPAGRRAKTTSGA